MRASFRLVAAALSALLLSACASRPAGPVKLPIGAPIEAHEAPTDMAATRDRARAAIAAGRFAEAEALFREMVATAERAHGAESIEAAQAIGWLAGFLDGRLRHTEAETLYRRQQAIVTAYYAPWRAAGRLAEIVADADRLGIDLYGENLGLNLTRQGRRGEAEIVWQRARAAHAAAGDTNWEPPEIAGRGGLSGISSGEASELETRRAAAAALLDEGRYAEAEVAARAILAGGDDSQSAYLLARALQGQAKWAEAEPLLDRLLATLSADRSPGFRLQVALALANNHYERGNLAESERLYRIAGQAYERNYGPHYPDTLAIRQMLAFLLERQGRFADAAAAYREVCVGRSERARAYSRGGMAGLAPSRAVDAAECGGRLAAALRRLARAGDDAPALREEAFTAAQAFQQSAAGDSLARSGARTAAANAGAGDLAARYEALLAARAAVDERLRSETGGDPAAAAHRDGDLALRALQEREIDRLAVELADRQPLYWDLRAPEPLTVAALRAPPTAGEAALLRDDEALVVFMVPRGDTHGLVFAVSRDGAAWADIPLTGDEIAARVRALRAQIDPLGYGLGPASRDEARREPGQGPFDRRTAFELYQALLGDPAIQAVIAGPPTLLIVPSGALTSLPPGLLVTAPPEGDDADQAALRGTHWLLRDKAIALLPSVSSLRTLRRLLPARERPTEPLLAFANPDFGGTPAALPATGPVPRAMSAYFREGRPLGEMLRTLRPLPGTAEEGMALAGALGAPREAVLTGAAASKAALFARDADGRLARVRVVEFATHGLIAGDAVGLVEPSLVLAAGATPEDGLLTASEAARLTLNADWVLLSACNTASPDAAGADGLSGLARAFFHAGARSLLVSHWRVNDGIAPVLVPAILERMAADPTLTRAAAVRLASLAILDDEDIPAAHPAIWAPFTLVGEAGR